MLLIRNGLFFFCSLWCIALLINSSLKDVEECFLVEVMQGINIVKKTKMGPGDDWLMIVYVLLYILSKNMHTTPKTLQGLSWLNV